MAAETTDALNTTPKPPVARRDRVSAVVRGEAQFHDLDDAERAMAHAAVDAALALRVRTTRPWSEATP